LNVGERFLLIVVLAVLVSGFIVISSIPKKSAIRAAFVVLIDGQKTEAPKQSYPEVNSDLSFEYKQAMAKTLLEYNQNG
jgi:hypothetical protein